MKIIKIFLLLSVSFLLSECKKSTEICENKLVLIRPKNDMKIINLSLKKNTDTLLNDIEKQIGKKFYGKETEFAILVNNRAIKINIRTLGKIPGSIISQKPYTIIVVNNEGRIRINDIEINNINEIPNWFNKNYPIITIEGTDGISLQWSENMKKEMLYETIEKIIDGYLLSAENVSKKNFNKTICKLNQNEISELTKTIPFKLKLASIDTKLIPLKTIE